MNCHRRDRTVRDEITITTTLVDEDGNTDVVAVYDGLSSSLAPADNDAGGGTRATRNVRRTYVRQGCPA
jgi:hypothetical protein